MGKAVPTVAIVSSAFAFFAALILSLDATFILAIVGIAGGILLALMRRMEGYVAGGVLIVLSLAGAFGVIGTVSTEDGGVDFGIDNMTGRALLVIAMAVPAAAILWTGWDAMENWVRYGGAGIIGLFIITVVTYREAIGDQSQTGSFVVALLALLTSMPAIMELRGPID